MILVAAALFATGRAVLAEPPEGSSGLAYTVREGDTVWSIARRTVGDEGDPRPLVEAIARANSIDPGVIVPGQILLIPPPA